MNWERVREKLSILADAAKYDVSCASSGSSRKNKTKTIGNSEGMGICHTYTEDGRCVSLLKILLSNHCIFDCAYCVSRKSIDKKRVAFSVEEVVEITINFYRRNYIEGLFLSSGIFKSPDYTMERLVKIAKTLREIHLFNGYIHLKGIPGSSKDLCNEAAKYADRVSFNLEIPTTEFLKRIAPEKNHSVVYDSMDFLQKEMNIKKEESPDELYLPAGQSTQLIVGASPESDLQIISLAEELYKNKNLKRVYYSGYVPVSNDSRLPVISKPPLIRENRLYQADWLIRFYGFNANEILDERSPFLDEKLDPKMAYAMRHPEMFPIDVNDAGYFKILRIPGLGIKTAKMIVQSRKFGKIRAEHLRKMGVAWNRAKYFLVCADHFAPQFNANTKDFLLTQTSQLQLFS